MKLCRLLRKYVNNLRIGVKLTCLICITCLLMLLFVFFTRNSVYDAYNEQIYSQTAQTLYLLINHIEIEFEELDQLTLSIIGNDSIQNNLSVIKDKPSELCIDNIRTIDLAIKNYQRTMNNKYHIAIRLKDGNLLGRTEGYIREDLYIPLLSEAEEKNGDLVYSFYEDDIIVLREIREIENMSLDNVGTIFLKIPFSRIMEGLDVSQKGIEEDVQISIFEEGNLLFSTANNIDLLSKKNGWAIVGEYFVVQRYSKSTNWIFQIKIPFENVNSAVKVARNNAVIIMCVVTFCVAIFGSAIIYLILRHVQILVQRFDEYGKGMELDALVAAAYEGRKDEIGELHNRFTQMATQHEKVTQDYYNNLLLLKDAQFAYLQTQMNPHFLYNTLATITWLAYENDDFPVAQMSEKLGKLVRKTIRNEKKEVTLREELEVVRDYLHIQQFRYSDRLHTKIICPEELLEVQMPPMTLQPIVENAIFHVVEETLEPCKINIIASLRDNLVEICVEDSGGKINVGIIEDLKTGKTVAKGNGVGLINIDERIKYLYSEQYGLKISCENGYSKVTVQLPFQF